MQRWSRKVCSALPTPTRKVRSVRMRCHSAGVMPLRSDLISKRPSMKIVRFSNFLSFHVKKASLVLGWRMLVGSLSAVSRASRNSRSEVSDVTGTPCTDSTMPVTRAIPIPDRDEPTRPSPSPLLHARVVRVHRGEDGHRRAVVAREGKGAEACPVLGARLEQRLRREGLDGPRVRFRVGDVREPVRQHVAVAVPLRVDAHLGAPGVARKDLAVTLRLLVVP